MLALKARQDGFRITLPKEIIPDVVNEKYSKILQDKRGFIIKPIDFLNETIQSVEVLGFLDATVYQEMPTRGEPMMDPTRVNENNFFHPATQINYRSPKNPQSLVDKTINITFKHTLGYLNYFILFESFLYHYCRDMEYKDLQQFITIDLLSETGSIFSKITLFKPLIDSMDMLTFDYTQPIASSQTFKVVFKYTSFNYDFVDPNIE